ncbi:MAG: hypothetical protein O3C28_19325 [Proteobacteria bacterium]|nr:hypothetical protein [Pseudomonadota bacterium]
MYIVAFMYPSAAGNVFNYDHFVNVHLPLGVGLTEKYLGIKPEKIVVYTPITGGDGESSSSPYSAISSVYFKSEKDAKAFSTLFTYEEAARRLSEDFANYTPGAPDLIISRVHELADMDGMIRDFQNSEAA